MLHRVVVLSRSATCRRLALARQMSSQQYQTYEFDSVTSGVDERWPVTRTNLVLNMCQESEKIVVERLGKFHLVYNPGWFVAMPIIDKLAYVIDTRERSLDVTETLSTSEDLSVVASCSVTYALGDAYAAAYGSSNPTTAIRHQVETALRNAVGEQSLEKAVSKTTARSLGGQIKEMVKDSALSVGVEVRRVDVLDILPENEEVAKAMNDLEDVARREIENRAEKELAQHKAEIVELEARANANAIRELAQAEADATKIRTAAAADAIKVVSAVLNSASDRDAAHFVLGQLQVYAGQNSLVDKEKLLSSSPSDSSSDNSDKTSS